MKYGPHHLVIVVVLLWLLSPGTHVWALNDATHELVNSKAAQPIDTTLRDRLGFGLDAVFSGTSALRWIELGGRHEDDGSFFDGTGRFYRHFHDPTQDSWDTAGLDFLFTQYQSSARWMQRVDQDAEARGTGNWGWPRARQLFTQALTAPQPTGLTGREQGFADLFRALGQVMHLIADASVPEHTRNDAHPMESVLRALRLRGYGNYEYWVSDQHGQSGSAEEQRFIDTYLSAPIGPNPDIFAATTGDTVAPVSIARLIDTKTYRGLDPNLTLAGPIGLTEFANANFFSEDTGRWRLFGRNYPFPDARRLVRADIPDPDGRITAYFGKGAGDGLPVFPVLAECVLPGPPSSLIYCTDEEVWKQVAAVMLPRSVGYASAVLDYFFRGQLDARIELDYNFVPPAHMLRVTNRTDGEVMSGNFALHYESSDGTRKRLRAWGPLTLEPGQTSAPLPLPPPPLDQAEPGRYLVVFQGQLGQERDAIVGRWMGAGLYSVGFWYDTYYLSYETDYPAEGGLVRFVPAPLPPWYDVGINVDAYASHQILIGVDPSYPTGEFRSGTVGELYDPAGVLPGNAATLRFMGWCYGAIGVGPVTAALVELETPRDLAALYDLTWSTRPAVRRRLHTFSVLAWNWDSAQAASVNLDGAAFLGLELLSVSQAAPPPPTPPGSLGSSSYGECRATMRIPTQPGP